MKKLILPKPKSKIVDLPLSNKKNCLELAKKIYDKKFKNNITNSISIESIKNELYLITSLDRFAKTKINKDNLRLYFTTKPIEIMGVKLGEFKVEVIHFYDLSYTDVKVIPIKPNFSKNDSAYFHPTVSISGYLCLGDGQDLIQYAINDCRFFDACLIINTILSSYSDEGFTSIENWNGKKCTNCLEIINREYFCRCGLNVCKGCGIECECNRFMHSGCLINCSNCEEKGCYNCIKLILNKNYCKKNCSKYCQKCHRYKIFKNEKLSCRHKI